jgi:tellurite resistance-related uncharacterized protein
MVESESTTSLGNMQSKENLTSEFIKQADIQTDKKIKEAAGAENSYRSTEIESHYTTFKKSTTNKPQLDNYSTTTQQKKTELQTKEFKEKGVKGCIIKPNIQLNIKPRTDKTNKKLKFYIENKGEALSKEALNNIKLKYNIVENTESLINARLKRGGTADVNGIGMGDLLNSGLKASQQKDFELIIENENANSFTIKVLLEGVRSKQPVIVKWKKEKDKLAPLPNVQMTLESRKVDEPKFVISLINSGEEISKKELKNI